MPRANSTHIGCSGAVEPSPSIAVPPFRTALVTSLKALEEQR
jgi:hypothetical protein